MADMIRLEHTAPNVHREFLEGNFVVKEANGTSNQVHTDMALEHSKIKLEHKIIK